MNNGNEIPAGAGSSARAQRFNRAMGALVGIPGVLNSKPATVRAVTPMTGDVATFIVQTYRQRDEGEQQQLGNVKTPAAPSGDWVFIEYVDDEGSVRIVIPPNVAAVIARQRDTLAGRMRSRAAKRVAAERKAAGIAPGFMRHKKTAKK